jgi:hypothetical protein
MSTGLARQAHQIVSDQLRPGRSAWRLDAGAVAARLHDLIDNPDLVRQGRLNLCGPAALMRAWLARDPVAVATYAARLFADGRAPLGSLEVRASAPLRALEYTADCPQADWMMMAALRDSSNRVLRYRRQGGIGEAAAGITMPRSLAGWLRATGLYREVRNETNLVRPKGTAHAYQLEPGPGREILLLVAQEMFRRRSTARGRARDRVVGLIPNHWVVLVEPVRPEPADLVRLRFWTWGSRYEATLDRNVFARGYHGCLVAECK